MPRKGVLTSTDIIKNYDAEDGEGIFIEGYLSKAIIDRDREIIPITAFDTKYFSENPIVLYQHDRQKPIGKFVDFKITNDGVWGKAFISNTSEKLYGVISLIKQGILKAFSIGFSVKKAKYAEEIDAVVYEGIILNECSIVSVPANPETLFAEVKSLSEEVKSEIFKTSTEVPDMEKETLLKELEEAKRKLKEKEEQEKAEREKAEKALLVAEKEELKSTIKTLVEKLDSLSSEVKSAKEEVETIKAARPKIQISETSEKAIDENVNSYKDMIFESQIFKKAYTDTASFKRLPEGLKSVTLDAAFTTKINNKILEDIKVQAPLFNLFAKGGSNAKTDVYPFSGTVTPSWGTLTKTNYSFNNKITFDYKKVLAGVEYSYNDEDEAIIVWLPKIRADITEAIADGIENALINSTATAGFANAPRGLINYAEGAGFGYTMTGSDNTLTSAHLSGTRAALGKYGVNPSKIVYVMNALKYMQLLNDGNLITVDKLANQATLLTGSMGKILGSDVLVTELFPGDDTATASAYSAMAIRTDMFMVKNKPILIEIDKNIETQNKVIVASMNMSFAPLIPLDGSSEIPTTNPIVALCINGI